MFRRRCKEHLDSECFGQSNSRVEGDEGTIGGHGHKTSLSTAVTNSKEIFSLGFCWREVMAGADISLVMVSSLQKKGHLNRWDEYPGTRGLLRSFTHRLISADIYNQSEELTLLWTVFQMVRKARKTNCVPVRGEDVVSSSKICFPCCRWACPRLENWVPADLLSRLGRDPTARGDVEVMWDRTTLWDCPSLCLVILCLILSNHVTCTYKLRESMWYYSLSHIAEQKGKCTEHEKNRKGGY